MNRMSTTPLLPLPRERLLELLVSAPAEEVGRIAGRVIEVARVEVVRGPDVGLVSMQVREPVAGERFLLADVLATVVEVDVDGSAGWAMRLGDDRVTTLACAIGDAVASHASPSDAVALIRHEIDDLCIRTAERLAADEQDERELLAPTVVGFEELD